MLTITLFIAGFIFLIKGADFLVDGASSIAKRLKISDIAIGLTIVSFGTSAPELIVNIFASLEGSTDIAIGNILGSNIANIFLILGVSSLIYPLVIRKSTAWKEVPLSLLAALTVGVLANDHLIDGRSFSQISRADGLILLSFFVIFLYYTFGIAKVNGESEDRIKKVSLPKSVLFIILGLFGLTLGGKWIVDGAVFMAQSFGLSESLIGLTVVAIGTSLPELAASAVAAYKKNPEIAIGNVVGSNIFNLFWILGISSVINPLNFNLASNVDIQMVVFASFLLFAFIFIGRKHVLDRWQGALFLSIYVSYIGYLIWKG